MTGKKTVTKKKQATRKRPSKKAAAANPKQRSGIRSAIEEASAAEDQNPSLFPVVGVGASAGGLEAFRELLKHLPTDTGMAFVLVQHLDPHHESMLVSLLSDSTTMPVYEARDNIAIAPNTIYVIPPDTNMGILHGTLQLVKRQAERGRYLPVDWFLRTLAEDRGNGAIGVILSGTASDGTLGLKAVKAASGIAFAQDEASAEYFGMPGNAIAAGCVDFVLPPREIAREIGRIARHPYLLHERLPEVESAGAESSLNKVFLLLRSRTGHDFTYYKHATIKRRIKRRMLVHKLDRLSDYVRLLEQAPAEVDELFQDILINVTGFFRDPDAFAALEKKVFPILLNTRPTDAPLRIWVAGCATGEEAYTLAIALLEYLDDRAVTPSIQIFATDIDEQAIEKARQGIYPERIVDELTPGRLKRFFIKVSGGYQVSKTVRDLCVFATQDITRDPPFSRLDLVCCRNLLIYLGAVLQKKVLQIFHYALQPGGFLMLGTSETVGRHADLFKLVDKKHKLYGAKSTAGQISCELTPRTFFQEEIPPVLSHLDNQTPFYDLHQQVDREVLARYGPPGVVISSALEILQFRGETGPYLNPVPGGASLNLLKMARQEFAPGLRDAVRKASREGIPVRKEGIRLRDSGYERIVDLQVVPMSGDNAGEYNLIVLFEEIKLPAGTKSAKQTTKTSAADRTRIKLLEQELITNREYMQSIIEEQETSNEELKSANEEIQSTNEELQSTNEELETAKEELQSTNEELATVNDELENRNLELGAANNDLTNLLASVNLPILMLSEDLRIRQFTPQVEKLLNLIDSDVGRPISQIRPNIDIPDLAQMVGEVIDNMVTNSIELQDHNGHWYSLRVRPYKTLENRIEGAVITFIDIDDFKSAEKLRQMRDELLVGKQRLQGIIDNSATVIYVKDRHGRYQLINRHFEELFKVERQAIPGKTDYEIFPKRYADCFQRNDREVLKSNSAMEFEETVPQDDGEHTYLSAKFPLYGADGQPCGVCGISTDITQRRREGERLRRLATVVRDANDAITMQDFDGAILAWNPAAERIYGWSEDEALGMNIRDIIPVSEQKAIIGVIEEVRQGKRPDPVEVVRITRKGEEVRVCLTASLLVDAEGKPSAVATTERKL